MAPPARTATTKRNPSKSGTKNPREPVVADTRGGKTVALCHTSAQGSEPHAGLPTLRERELAALEDANQLERRRRRQQLRDSMGMTPLPLMGWSIPPMDDGEAGILRLLAQSPDGAATFDAIDRDQGPQDCQPYTTTRMRRLQQRGYIEHEPLPTREKPTDPADRAAWLEELGAAYRASTWRLTETGTERARRLAPPPPPANPKPASGSDRATPKPSGYTRAQLADFIEDESGITFSETNFRALRQAAGIPARPEGGTGSKAQYSIAEIRQLADHLDTTGIRRHAKIADLLRARIE